MIHAHSDSFGMVLELIFDDSSVIWLTVRDLPSQVKLACSGRHGRGIFPARITESGFLLWRRMPTGFTW